MAGKAGLKAGLIGALVLLVLTLLNQIQVPFLGCICCGVTLLAYAGIGALAGNFMPPPRSAGTGAGAGAIAGLISGVAAWLVWTVALAIQMLVMGTEGIMSQIDPQTMQQLQEMGVELDPQMFAALSGVTGVVIVSGLCCLWGLAMGAGLGALGGAIFGAAKRD